MFAAACSPFTYTALDTHCLLHPPPLPGPLLPSCIASGPQEPSVEVRLQCRAVVGVATLAGLVACAADEYDGPAALSPAQVGCVVWGRFYVFRKGHMSSRLAGCEP